MHDVTQILSDNEAGNSEASAELLPIVYDELKKMAQSMMNRERGDHTLQTTALVHKAYVRLVDKERPQSWSGRGHFFSAATEAMRRILVEHARRKLGKQRGGDKVRVELADDLEIQTEAPESIVQVSEAIQMLAEQDAQAAELVKLHYFAGFSIVESAAILGISKSTAYSHWAYAKAMLAKLLA